MIYQGNCIIVGDYLYSFNINDSAPDKNKLNVFPININQEHTVNRKFNKNNSFIIKSKPPVKRVVCTGPIRAAYWLAD